VPAWTYEQTNEALRAQLDEHRGFLLQQQRFRESLAPIRQAVPMIPVHVVAAKTNRQGLPVYQHMSFAGQPSPPPMMQLERPTRAYRPVAGDVATYPPALREAIDQANSCVAMQPAGGVFQVMHRSDNGYLDDETQLVARCTSVSEANLKVAQFFIETFWYNGMDEPTFEVDADGRLRCEIETDGSMGAFESIYVKDGDRF
jgi:hypothetical protein